MKQVIYCNPTNIDEITEERVKSYFSVLYCEIVHPTTKKFVQRTGLLTKTHLIIGASNLLPFKSVDCSLEVQWREINEETDEIIKRVAFVPTNEHQIIMQNLISAFNLFEKITHNVIDSADEVTGTWFPNAEKMKINVSGEPQGLKRVKGLVNDVMNKWKIFFELEKIKSQIALPQQIAPTDATVAKSQKTGRSGIECKLTKDEIIRRLQGTNDFGYLFQFDRARNVHDMRLFENIATFIKTEKPLYKQHISLIADILFNYKPDGSKFIVNKELRRTFSLWHKTFYKILEIGFPQTYKRKDYDKKEIRDRIDTTIFLPLKH